MNMFLLEFTRLVSLLRYGRLAPPSTNRGKLESLADITVASRNTRDSFTNSGNRTSLVHVCESTAARNHLYQHLFLVYNRFLPRSRTVRVDITFLYKFTDFGKMRCKCFCIIRFPEIFFLFLRPVLLQFLFVSSLWFADITISACTLGEWQLRLSF